VIKELVIKAIVTDIEGTTSSLSFVKDILFPYARQNLRSYVVTHLELVQPILAEIRAIADHNLTVDECLHKLEQWMDQDQKITPLKTLQGLIWQQGYETGEFKGHIYDDAVWALQQWHDLGIKLYIYSSGSIAAQKLLFGYSEAGDLNYLISGYFDTGIGNKLAKTSYEAIAVKIGYNPVEILFLSDHPQELAAAQQAEFNVIGLQRGMVIPELGSYPTVTSFTAINLIAGSAAD